MKVYVIAEAGVNHNGDIELAHKLVDEAVKSGADAVKFQTFKAENLTSKKLRKLITNCKQLIMTKVSFKCLRNLSFQKRLY